MYHNAFLKFTPAAGICYRGESFNIAIYASFGYCDIHNTVESQGVYIDENYPSPEQMQRDIKGIHEIFVGGEEGVVASPPHLELINKHNKSTNEKIDGMVPTMHSGMIIT